MGSPDQPTAPDTPANRYKVKYEVGDFTMEAPDKPINLVCWCVEPDGTAKRPQP